jgi:hypothetical protein
MKETLGIEQIWCSKETPQGEIIKISMGKLDYKDEPLHLNISGIVLICNDELSDINGIKYNLDKYDDIAETNCLGDDWFFLMGDFNPFWEEWRNYKLDTLERKESFLEAVQGYLDAEINPKNLGRNKFYINKDEIDKFNVGRWPILMDNPVADTFINFSAMIGVSVYELNDEEKAAAPQVSLLKGYLYLFEK